MTNPTAVRREALTIGVLMLSLLWASVTPAFAQESDAAAQGADTTTAKPIRPISVSDIPGQTVAVVGLLTRIGEALAMDTVVDRADSELIALETAIGEAGEGISPESLDRIAIHSLDEVEQSWRAYDTQIGALEGRLEEWGAVAESMTLALDSARTRWTLTRDSVPADTPAELRDRIDIVLTRIDSVNTEMRGPRDRILSLRDRAVEASLQVRNALDHIARARSQARRRMFRRDAPPVWQLVGVPEDSPVYRYDASLGRRLNTAGEYIRTHAGRMWLQAFLAVIIAAAMYGLRRRVRRDPQAERGGDTLAVFDRPIAVGLLISLALTRYIHHDAPIALYVIMWLAALPPLAVLLPFVLPRGVRKAGYLVLTITLIALPFELFVTSTAWLRLAALGVALAGIVAFALLLTARDLRERASRGGWWRGVRAGAWAGIGLLCASILANALGFLALAGILVTGPVYSAFMALVATAAAAALEALLAALVHTVASKSDLVRVHQDRLIRRGGDLIRLLAAGLWLVGSLRLFWLLEPVYGTVKAVLSAEVALGTWNLSLGRVLAFALSLWLAVIAARVTQTLLRDEVFARLALPRGVPDTFSRLSYYVVLALGLLFAFGAAGIDLTRLTIIVGALGVGIGFGLQSIVHNFISGLILLFERPIQIGDVVELDTLLGTVRRIGIRASVIRTFSGSDVIVPNGDLVASRVINWTHTDQMRRVEIPVGVAYGSDPQRVIEVLTEVAAAHPDTLADPEPATQFTAFGDSSLNFMIWVWTERFDRWVAIRTEIYQGAYAALADAGIAIPFPQRDLHLRSLDPEAARALRASSTDAP